MAIQGKALAVAEAAWDIRSQGLAERKYDNGGNGTYHPARYTPDFMTILPST